MKALKLCNLIIFKCMKRERNVNKSYGLYYGMRICLKIFNAQRSEHGSVLHKTFFILGATFQYNLLRLFCLSIGELFMFTIKKTN